MNNDLNDIFCKLLFLDNSDDILIIKNDIIQKIKNNNHNKTFILDNPEFNFINSLCVCNIKKQETPDWKSKCKYKLNDNYLLNITHNRLILYKYDDLIVYVEKNGQFKLLNSIFNKFNNSNVIFNKKNINTPEILNEEITNYILNKNENLNNLKECCNKINLNINNYINDDEYSYNNFINLYEDLKNNKLLDDNKKLSNLIFNDCLNNNKNGYNENKYNKLICDKNPNKYILLDCKKQDYCEIADIYDKQNKLLFHNKRNKDLRILSSQIINGLLILKTKSEICKNYINKYTIDENNFKYVFGIIKEKENITTPHKLAIGLTCHILRKLNVDYYIDFIEVIKE